MERIIAPVIRNDRGAAVHNLQDGLLLLLNGNGSELTETDRRALADKLASEQREGIYSEVTADAVKRFQREHQASFDLIIDDGSRVDDATAGGMNRMLQELGAFQRVQSDGFIVTGRVEFEDGSPGIGLRVNVFDRDLGVQREPLGDAERPAITGEDGVFPAIRYQARDFAVGEGHSGLNADLVFEVFGANDQGARDIAALYRRFTTNGQFEEIPVPDLVLGFQAAQVEDVRIVLAGRPGDGGLAEYQRLMLALEPLFIEGASPATFDQEHFRDIDFSARETGWDRALIETMSLSWQLAQTASREPQLLAETFYGLLRHGAPTEVPPLATTLDELLNQDARWSSKLEDSLAHRIIEGSLDQHLGHLRDLRTDAAARPGSGRRAGIGDVLAHVGIADADQRTLLGAYHAHDGTIEEFWLNVVPQRLGWDKEKIRVAQTALQLADVLAYDIPLITDIRGRGIAASRDLVKLDHGDWIDIVKRVGPSPDAQGDTAEEKITRTVDAITAVIAATYPTETMAQIASLSQDPQLAAARDLLSRFFEREIAADGTGFDLRTSPVTTYLETHGERVFREMPSADTTLLTSQLQRLQRVFRLGVDRVQTEALLDLGIDSAFHVTRFSPEHFVEEFGERLGGAERASLVYGRAERIAGTVLYVHSDLWQGIHGVQPMAIRSAAAPDKIPALKELPAYKALFGNLEMCDCGHCQSFYSPAAYFVDLLHLLDRPGLKPINPVEELFRRRPDLGHIQLTCENTNTLIPYVDLVTEVLESFVANGTPTPFNVPPGPPNRLLPSPSADELRVNPVYLTTASSTFADQAYKALQEAVFPLTLPLNLPLETTRTYLNHLGVSRDQLMTLFDRDTGIEAVMALAAEILLLSPEEFEIITGANFGGSSSLRPATTAEMFGLSLEPTPSTLFNHAAPEFVRNVAKPDERAASIRSLQNILSIISPAPIPVNGIYDANTEAAVNAFLKKKGLVQNGRSDDAFWGALEADGMPSLSVLLCPVSMFLDRSSLTYEELVAIVRTRFVNPTLQGERDLDYLARLGIPAADIRAWIQAGLPAMPAPIQTKVVAAGEDPVVFTTWVTRRTRSVVINTAFETPCDLDRATLMHLDGTLLSPDELVSLFQFIRLWRKLGWTIADLDLVLEPGALESSAVFNTMLLLANVKQLRERLKTPIADIVTLWQSIPTHGDSALYDKLFRNRAAQLIDPVLELNREHTELKAAESATPPAISDHIGSLLAAFRLTAPDLTTLRTALKLNDDLALPPAARPPLNLAALSSIYKYVALARALRLSITELLTLNDLSGLAVFERPDRVPRGNTILFVDLVEKVRAAGVKVGVLEYLCRGVAQASSLPDTQRSAWSTALASIIDGLRAIESEDPIKDDPDGEELTARLTALIGPDDARAATALIYGRDVYKTQLSGLPAAFAFPVMSQRLSYDASRKELKLRGAMTGAERALLLAAGVPPAVQADYLRAIKTLDTQPRTFVARALKPLFTAAEAEAVLIENSSLDISGAPIQAAVTKKIADVLARRRTVLSRSMIKQTFTTATNLPADIVELLLENKAVLKAMGGAGPAMDDYQEIDGDGLDAVYFTNPDLTDPSTLLRVDKTIGFNLQGAVPGPGIPAAGFSVRWTGSLYVPAAGEVTFRARCTDGVQVTVNDAIVIDEWRDQSETEFNATLRLDGGQFYPIEVRYYNKTGDALLELSWTSPSIAASTIPQASLYSAARYESLLQRVERIYKVALLITPFILTGRDLQQLSEHGDLSLDLMPLIGPTALSAAQVMFAQWLVLFDFAALRDRYPGTDLSLMDVPAAPTRAEAVDRFSKLSGATAELLAAILDAFNRRVFDTVTLTWKTEEPDLTLLSWWERIADALALVQQTGAAPGQLLAWAKAREILELPTGPETGWFTWTATDLAKVDRRAENAQRAQEAKNLVRSRYDEARWLVEARLLNDVLRLRRRTALTSYVLAMPAMMRAHVSDTGRLFEFLLIDVEMDPCMETSRIKQGISSVQTFIQRVLLNLESPQVPPGRVDRARWEWTKNYRVWEANRKVFLYAESYVEEELRDNKTPIFKELESELLQDDLTEPNAERVFRHYLEKLDDVAKLVVCGSCVDSDEGVLHVFARTSTTPFVFYHRQLNNHDGLSWTEGVWTPWQKLPVDVAVIDDGENSGVSLMPIVWNRRIYLFWPLFEQKRDDEENARLPQGFDQVQCWHVKLAWSEYKDGQWSPKQTSVPFVKSGALVERLFGVDFFNDLGQPVPYSRRNFLPDHVTTTFKDLLGKEHTFTTPVSTTITGDDMLNGTKLEPGDSAVHEHVVIGTAIRSLLPKPAEHYLDARISDSELMIQLFSRFQGNPTGLGRTITEDRIDVVRGGELTHRLERRQDDFVSNGHQQRGFKLVGVFHFPSCTSEIDASQVGQQFEYLSLVRPELTINSFMALRHERNALERVTGPLRLTTGAAPILAAAPRRLEVIDSDNRSGFDRSGPFFYQDQKRCYLVIRETSGRFGTSDVLRVEPNTRSAALERAVGVATITDRQLGIAPESALSANPWAHTALTTWANGPGLLAAIGPGAAPSLNMLSGSFTPGSLLSQTVKDQFNGLSAQVHPEYTFLPHWHPYTCSFIAALNKGGLPGLFTLDNEALTDAKIIFAGVIGGPMPIFTANNFEFIYKPDASQVVKPYPIESVDFSRSGSYSQYNWETFFHAPMTVAMAHSRAGRYEDALRWFHFVFDPMTGDADTSDQRFWRFLPFRTADTARIEDTISLLTYAGTDSAKLKQRANLQASIQEWLNHPFNPHLIARRRPVVYMKYVFMKYLDNLIAWADELFMRDTMEAINEATQLYILAANLLGPRPQRVPAPGSVAPETYQTLRGRLDELSNAQVDLETRLPFTQLFGPGTGAIGQLTRLPQSLYFCLPQNDNMLAYWDTIADRLFKIRHCMSIDGTIRQLPLFEPEINPKLLVDAVAHGLDIGSVLNDLYAPLPSHRFTFMLQQALAMCSEVRALGSSLLSVLEKRDGERLASLRAQQEQQLLDQVKANKKLMISESEQSRQALENTARMISARIDYFDSQIAQGLISEETDQLVQLDASNRQQETASWIEATAQMLNLVPNVSTGTPSCTTFGGSNLGAATSAVGRSISSEAASHAYKANRASITGGHSRRMDDWRFQRDQAKREKPQVERQIAAAVIRKEITEADLRNHETAIDHARNIENLLRNKFTNESLYGWMEGQLRTVYFQCYKAAYEIARRAERCFQYQLGTDASFIKYGAWDSSVRGLLAGERLYQQLKQMERAYIEQQVREFEITKHVSVLQLDPLALIALKETGRCEVAIPEWMFDVDYPGHYFRRLKTVSMTIPAVVGPYTSVSATLTLLSSKVRTSSRVQGTYEADENFRSDHLAVEAIAASTAQNDSGRFQLDFRDEKYLPFEGAGAVSTWRIELPNKFRAFNYDTISDVILHLRYTSRRDEILAGPAVAALQAELDAADGAMLFRFFSLRHEFPNEWQMLRTSGTHMATFTIPKDRFPLLAQQGSVTVREVHSALILKEPRPAVAYKATLTQAAAAPISLDWLAQSGRYRSATKATTVTIPISTVPADSSWKLQITQPTLLADLDQIQDILIVLNYSVTM